MIVRPFSFAAVDRPIMLQDLEKHDLRRWEVRRVADGGKEFQGSADGRFEEFGEVKA